MSTLLRAFPHAIMTGHALKKIATVSKVVISVQKNARVQRVAGINLRAVIAQKVAKQKLVLAGRLGESAIPTCAKLAALVFLQTIQEKRPVLAATLLCSWDSINICLWQNR